MVRHIPGVAEVPEQLSGIAFEGEIVNAKGCSIFVWLSGSDRGFDLVLQSHF